MHLHNVCMRCDTIKLNGVSADTNPLRLFPFSMRDRARDWLQNEAVNALVTWDALSNAFLSKYFPPKKTAKLRANIITFTQLHDESLYEAWERLKDLQCQRPHHGIPDWLLVQTFYDVLDQTLKMSIDIAASGALMGKSLEATKVLFEDMTFNNYR